MPDRGLWLGCGLGRPVVCSSALGCDCTFPALAIWASNSGGSLRAGQGILTSLAINLPGCFRLLFLLSFIRKTENAWLKNPTDLLHKHLMKPLLTKKDGNLPILSGNDVV